MALIGAWVRDRLTSNKGVSDIVGDRVYPVFIPQRISIKRGEKPAITYRRLGTTRPTSHAGPTGFPTCRVRLTAWHEDDYDLACSAVDAARLAVDGLKNSANFGFDIRSVFVVDEADDVYTPQDGEGVPVFGPYCDVSVTYIETKKAY